MYHGDGNSRDNALAAGNLSPCVAPATPFIILLSRAISWRLNLGECPCHFAWPPFAIRYVTRAHDIECRSLEHLCMPTGLWARGQMPLMRFLAFVRHSQTPLAVCMLAWCAQCASPPSPCAVGNLIHPMQPRPPTFHEPGCGSLVANRCWLGGAGQDACQALFFCSACMGSR